MDPIVEIINKLILQQLASINKAIGAEIRSKNLDPMQHVVSANERLGSIDLGLCTAYVDAGYDVNNLAGMANFTIGSLQITSAGKNPQNAGQINGSVSIAASVGAISAGLGGRIGGGCGFLSEHIGLSGSASAASIQVTGTGTFQAGLANQQVCLSALHLDQLSLNYGGLQLSIDGLGIFNRFLQPLESLILDQFKGPIANLIAGALLPVLNSQINQLLPLCTPLPA